MHVRNVVAALLVIPLGGGTRFVAAFAPRSRVRSGDEAEVVVDTERMHFFVPVTGVAIRG